MHHLEERKMQENALSLLFAGPGTCSVCRSPIQMVMPL